MRNYVCGSLLVLLLICNNAFADVSIQKVELAPLTGGVSFNTITFADRSITGWVTASSVIGRKEIMIINTSTNNSVFITGVSGSTATGTIFPRESVTFKASSNLNIYVSSNSVAVVEIWEIR